MLNHPFYILIHFLVYSTLSLAVKEIWVPVFLQGLFNSQSCKYLCCTLYSLCSVLAHSVQGAWYPFMVSYFEGLAHGPS